MRAVRRTHAATSAGSAADGKCASSMIAFNFSRAALAQPCHFGRPGGLPMNVHVGRRDRVAALGRHQCPVRAHLVVAPAEHFKRFPRLAGAGVQLPVHLLGFQRLVEALEQPELGRRPVPDAHVGIVAVDVSTKRPREEARPIVGDRFRDGTGPFWTLSAAGWGKLPTLLSSFRMPEHSDESCPPVSPLSCIDRACHPVASWTGDGRTCDRSCPRCSVPWSISGVTIWADRSRRESCSSCRRTASSRETVATDGDSSRRWTPWPLATRATRSASSSNRPRRSDENRERFTS